MCKLFENLFDQIFMFGLADCNSGKNRDSAIGEATKLLIGRFDDLCNSGEALQKSPYIGKDPLCPYADFACNCGFSFRLKVDQRTRSKQHTTLSSGVRLAKFGRQVGDSLLYIGQRLGVIIGQAVRFVATFRLHKRQNRGAPVFMITSEFLQRR